MSERIPYNEPAPSDLENRRDALLLRIVKLREKVKRTTPREQEMFSSDFAQLDTKIQQIEHLQDIAFYEEILDASERIVNSKLK